jgi:sugar O-acyltransferase (sialic acid O-acetyltransferase NeuD family)
MKDMHLAVYGCGGFGREIEPLASSMDADVVFVSDVPDEQGTVINHIPVISFDDLISPRYIDREVVLAIGSSAGRRALAAKCEAAGLRFGMLQAPTVRMLRDNEIGEGAVFCDYSMCTSNARIGRHFQCNIYSYVAHDCVIGDFVTFAPRVNCNGNVTIEDDVYVGTGAFLKQGVRIGRGATIGMGAVVTKDVLPDATVVGNPARVLER